MLAVLLESCSWGRAAKRAEQTVAWCKYRGQNWVHTGRGWLEQVDRNWSAAPGGGRAGGDPGLRDPPCWVFTPA